MNNVLAYLPGKTDEYVIIGAHYDHLGRGDSNSLAPSQIGQIHPGADDNASGTAGVLELARLFAPLKGQLDRGILFMSFSGEELGLLGSAEWVKDPTLPLDKCVAMLNMDMIGRIKRQQGVHRRRGHRFDVQGDSGAGAEAGTGFQDRIFRGRIFGQRSHLVRGQENSGAVLLLRDCTRIITSLPTPGTRSTRHRRRSCSTWWVTSRCSWRMRRQPPAFVTVVEDKPVSGGGGGYGPYFGSIPDFGEVKDGVRFSDVRPGSPAAKAGLKAGDILVQFGDKPIHNLYDFTDALRRSKVGEVVEVKVLRDGQPMTVSVKLEQRK